MKHQKIVQALDRMLYLIGKQRISSQGTQDTVADNDTLWNSGQFLAIVRQVKHCYLLVYERINSRETKKNKKTKKKWQLDHLLRTKKKKIPLLVLYPSRFKSTKDFMRKDAL